MAEIIPNVFSAKVLKRLAPSMAFAEAFTNEYSGEINDKGATVTIATVGEIKVSKYSKGENIAHTDEIAPEGQLLACDQADAFNFVLDDVRAFQTPANLYDACADAAALALEESADTYLGGILAAGAKTTTGSKSAPVKVNKDNAFEVVLSLKDALGKGKAPRQGRLLFVPEWFESLMLADPNHFGRFQDNVTEGTVYRAAGFDIKVTNAAPTEAGAGSVEVSTIIAAHPMQGGYANQLTKVETYRPEKRFGTGLKGLHVYGAKVLRPELVACAKVSPAA